MLISGLVIIFSAAGPGAGATGAAGHWDTEPNADPSADDDVGAGRRATLAAVESRDEITIGDFDDAALEQRESVRVPAVLESVSPRESRRLVEWIEQQQGIGMVEVVHVGFEEPESVPSCEPKGASER
ncbi:MAG: hypothetical protein ACYTGR_20200 [Planctomycetota bacterium]|jgi:hypothetical protein